MRRSKPLSSFIPDILPPLPLSTEGLDSFMDKSSHFSVLFEITCLLLGFHLILFLHRHIADDVFLILDALTFTTFS